MTKFRYGEFETEIDCMDLKWWEKYEAAMAGLKKATGNISGDSPFQVMREGMMAIDGFFSGLFGMTCISQMFGNSQNLRGRAAAVNALKEACNKSMDSFTAEFADLFGTVKK